MLSLTSLMELSVKLYCHNEPPGQGQDAISRTLNAYIEAVAALSRAHREYWTDADHLNWLDALRQTPLESISDDEVVCLECGQVFDLLPRHLVRRHGLTAAEYRLKYKMPKRQTLSSRRVTKKRGETARKVGAGAGLADYRAAKQAAKRDEQAAAD